jgi:transmembrane sensor
MRRDMESKPGVDQVEDAAAAWLLRRDDPRWSAADEALLQEWLRASPSHRVSYMRLRSVWREANRMKVVGAGFEAGRVPPRGEISGSSVFFRQLQAAESQGTGADASITGVRAGSPVTSGLKRQFNRRRVIAAGVALLVAFSGIAYWGSARDPSYSTPVGGLASVPMDDGSKILLNTNSLVTLEVSDQERRVNLSRGEAFFEVAKDPTRPFVVYADDKRVVAVGTKFAVRLDRGAVQVAVTEGQVRVEKEAVVGERQALANLAAGSVASAQQGKVFVRAAALADVERSLSWRSGHIVLRKMSLPDAVAEFNRYNRRQLVIEDPALREIRVGGNFQSNNVDGFVRLLQAGFAVRTEERSDRIILTRAAPTE